MTTPGERLAALDVRVTTLEKITGDIASDVRTTRDAVLEAKGGWRVLMLMGGACGVIGGFAGKWIPVLLAGIAK